jgi:hypothetical protein
MVEATCHCKAVRLELAAAPSEVFECNCSICWKLGVLWSYYPPAQVRIASPPDATLQYSWSTRSLAFHTCRTCGCTTHWWAIDVPDPRKMGVNARLIEGVSKAAVRVQHLEHGGAGKFWT